jgi:hypothetical protein
MESSTQILKEGLWYQAMCDRVGIPTISPYEGDMWRSEGEA